MRQDRGVAARGLVAVVMVMALLIIDQTVKIWVKTHMSLHEAIPVTDWFQITFIENNGMAYGMEFGSKLLLSVLRLALIALICLYMTQQIRKKAKWGYLVCIALIIAGALGNIIDGMVYGLIFSESTPFFPAHFVPFGSGYEGFMRGRVVDMLYFPLIVAQWPSWVPMVGGDDFVFFSPVFNIADSSITVGVAALLLFYRREVANISFGWNKAEGHHTEEKPAEDAEKRE